MKQLSMIFNLLRLTLMKVNHQRQSRWFSIIFDETIEAAHKEHMRISLRYVHNKTIREECIAFVMSQLDLRILRKKNDVYLENF